MRATSGTVKRAAAPVTYGEALDSWLVCSDSRPRVSQPPRLRRRVCGEAQRSHPNGSAQHNLSASGHALRALSFGQRHTVVAVVRTTTPASWHRDAGDGTVLGSTTPTTRDQCQSASGRSARLRFHHTSQQARHGSPRPCEWQQATATAAFGARTIAVAAHERRWRSVLLCYVIARRGSGGRQQCCVVAGCALCRV